MIEDYEVTVRKIILSATRNALSILKLDRRFSVSRTNGHPVDYDPVWVVDFFDKDNHQTQITIRPPLGVVMDETWYTPEIIRQLEELIYNTN